MLSKRYLLQPGTLSILNFSWNWELGAFFSNPQGHTKGWGQSTAIIFCGVFFCWRWQRDGMTYNAMTSTAIGFASLVPSALAY